MSFPFPHYAKIKNNYCLCYFGHSQDYLMQLHLITPCIEKQLPEIKMHICCNEEYLYLGKSIPKDRIELEKHNMAHLRELYCEKNAPHPIYSWITESSLNIDPFPIKVSGKGMALICPESSRKEECLSVHECNRLKHVARNQGYEPIIVGLDTFQEFPCVQIRPRGEGKWKLLNSVKSVYGVENEYIFMAISLGIPTSLVSTGKGLEFYKKLYPEGYVMRKNDHI